MIVKVWTIVMETLLPCRVGDTYPNQMLQVQVHANIFRWQQHGSKDGAVAPYILAPLPLSSGNQAQDDQLLLRMPVTLHHVIDEASPLSTWQTGAAGIAFDADSEIIVRVCEYAMTSLQRGDTVGDPTMM